MQEKQAVDAITVYLSRAGHALNPATLVSVVGAETGAAGCSLTVAGEQYVWGNNAGPSIHHQIVYEGEPQGTLELVPDSIGPLPTVMAVLGAPVAAIRLTTETDRLRRQADAATRQLIDDRWKATVEMEQERRSLERDLHDGAQHHIVALRTAVSLLEHHPADVRTRLSGLLSRLDAAERVLVNSAAGVLPIALASDGLAAGLIAELENHADVTLDVTGLRRSHSPAVEAAVYFTCLEAVSNAHKHARDAAVAVIVSDSGRGLEFTVADTGPGFSRPAKTSGLDNLSMRIADVGGRVEIRSSPAGTTVSGYVPDNAL